MLSGVTRRKGKGRGGTPRVTPSRGIFNTSQRGTKEGYEINFTAVML